jgi:DNA processing protein
MDERQICALLARTPGLTARHVRAAAADAGAPSGLRDRPGAAALSAVVERLRAADSALSPGARAYLSEPLRAPLDDDLRWLDASGAIVVPCTSALYPVHLAETVDAPPVLYLLGDAHALAARQVTMVGARAATPAGRAIAREMARELARAGLAVASGLAVGIDAASHEGALDAGGVTLAVCAHGLDCLYPPQHRGLARRIREHGALISRFPPGTRPTRQRFPWRNRTLSGLGAATVVVEAARGSGSLHTARFAVQQGRPVFAVPGSVRNPLSAGCHALLRQGARIAESAADVLHVLEISVLYQALTGVHAAARYAAPAAAPLDKGAEILLDAIGFEPVSLNTLVERTGLPSGGIASMLLMLELGGRVAPQPGGRWSRVS